MFDFSYKIFFFVFLNFLKSNSYWDYPYKLLYPIEYQKEKIVPQINFIYSTKKMKLMISSREFIYGVNKNFHVNYLKSLKFDLFENAMIKLCPIVLDLSNFINSFFNNINFKMPY